MNKHTPEPWKWVGASIEGPNYTTVLEVRDTPENSFPELQSGELICSEGDREHIISCVNACAGINPEAVPELLEVCKTVLTELQNYHARLAMNGTTSKTMTRISGKITMIEQVIAKAKWKGA